MIAFTTVLWLKDIKRVETFLLVSDEFVKNRSRSMQELVG
jgi:hypothetical protein